MLFLVLFSIIATVGASLTTEDITKCLGDTNLLRQLHEDTYTVEWDATLASKAQAWADHLILKGLPIVHDERNKAAGVGENIFWMKSARPAVCADAVLKWYNERDDYIYLTGMSKNSNDIGHFTQLVWKGTTKIGFGIASKAVGADVETFIVGRYSPAGNIRVIGPIQTEFIENVADLINSTAAAPKFHELPSGFCSDINPYCGYFKDNDYCITHKSAMAISCYEKCGGCL